ncbi:hypothetical protein ANCCAN_18212 [Ancylostoma caninum]|uniref:Uncharacterized protein n=1 Tax=Ancylostoma caninum TaxID=29170 RepID=A0A368FWP3_ANCCA|nr:hypothetical protein ANCCAN_18212 [Ancylostoma caninum]
MIQEGAFVAPTDEIKAKVQQEIDNANLSPEQKAIVLPLQEYFYAKFKHDFGFYMSTFDFLKAMGILQ